MKSSIKKQNNYKLLGILFFCIASLASLILIIGLSTVDHAYVENNIETHQYFSNASEDSLYLSDIEYIKNQSYAGWDTIRYDQINDGSQISVKIENGAFTFKKGIWAHANSQVTYDISNYDYKYFTAFVGINTTSARGDGVRFSIYTSEDGNNWGTAKYEEVKLPQQVATFVKIDISGAKYIRLIANQIGGNASDHAVYADAKLVNNAEESFVLKSVDDFNEIIKSQYNGQDDITGELEFNLLKKELVQNVGQYTINSFYNENEDNKAVIDWLMRDQKALRYYILGGKPEGSYYNSLTQLSRLYRNYKDDFENKEVTQYGTVLGDLYLRMAISLSLTHSKVVGLWMQSGPEENRSDAVLRYAIYKYMHKNGNLNVIAGLDIAKWFENYTIEEMRFVMNNNIDDEEILWLNAYTQSFIDAQGSVGSRLTPHPYMAYVWPNYGQDLYYSEENKDYFNELFSVPDKNNEGERIGLWDLTYTIPGGTDVPEYTIKITRGTPDYKLYKVWMNFRNKFGTGAVCGGISKSGSNIRGVHAIPSAVIGQPGHAAIIYYTQDANGNGYWNLDNDVSGWAYSEKGERMLLGWGNASYSRGYSVVYMALAQEVINDNDKFEQSEKFVYLADTYKDDLVKKEEAYRKALEIQPLNIDAWYGLITLYNESSDKTEDDYYELAEELAESLKYFPLPMTHLSNLIKPKLTSIENSYKFTLLQTRILTEASVVPNNTADTYYVYQPSLTRLMGKFLLGNFDSTIATFSFDGEDANKIVLSSRYDNNGIRWDYSIDGKKTWKEVSFTADEPHKWQLTEEEIAAITSENDIYVHIVGVNYNEENLYKIDINESAGLPATLFASDLENKLLGAVDSIEWKYNENDNWTRYGDEEPELTGDKTVILRMGATGTYLASNNSVTYTFTEDVINNKRKYIPVEHISLEAVSTEATNNQGSATFALDANYNTRWHSAWNGSDTQRYITVKLDQPYNISAVEFVPAGGGNGKIYDGTVWGSMDGENWFVLSQKKGLTYTNAADNVAQAIANIKSFDVDIPQRVQYVKIVADRTNGNWFTARAFNFYEDTTIKIVANFSFDGKDAGKINLIDSDYNNNWKYSVDGGTSWTSAVGNSHKLTSEELNKITAENGIKIMLGEDETEYSIKIKEADSLVINPYVNDLENRLIGIGDVSKLEWKYSDEDNWIDYSEEEPVVLGNKILQVRMKATGITLPSNALEYQYTEDNQTDKMKYIPISHLSIHGYSTQSIDSNRPFYAPNAIDGNFNTLWHTDFRYSVLQQEGKPYLTIKLDSPRRISALEFIQKKYRSVDPDDIKNAIVYVSMDGENWEEAGRIEDCPQDGELRRIIFDESVYGQYVKLEMETYGIFASVAMINLYEDVSQNEANVSINYDITNKTNKPVTAELVSDKDITIINNNGDKTFTFTENGTFTFEYRDKTGELKTIVAIVDWIDKVAPIGTISYSNRDVTNENVVVTLTTNEEVTIINNNGLNTYTFEENGEFTFEFVDVAGNKGTATANVTWINKKAPVGTITYSPSTSTNKSVTATLVVDEGVVVTNNGGSKSYTFDDNGLFTFEFVDVAGNRGTATANVTWIDRVAPRGAVTYSKDSLTNGEVISTLITNEEVIILNNNGSDKYVFTENGEFEFEFQDKAGNKGTLLAKVDWIDKDIPTAKAEYSETDLTNKDVVVTLKDFSEEVTILNNNGSDKYVFTENGEFEFEFQDKAGNKGTLLVKVDWIDKTAPTAKVEYSETELTNKDVIATLKDFSEEVTIINNNGSNTYTFTENGTFIFEIQDKAGNVSKIEAKVNNINKVVSSVKINYNVTDLTNKDVIATLISSEEVTIINNNGSNKYIFTENGTFTFEFIDKAGNKGTLLAEVDWIDKDVPTAKVDFSETELTNKDVVATLKEFSEEVTILNNNGSDKYTFAENGEFEFEIQDKAGNIAKIKVVVTNIDKVAPTAEVDYSVKESTKGEVIAILKDISEEITILNNNGSDKYTFTENGTFTFEFIDKAGNKGSVLAKVDWIVNNDNNQDNGNNQNNNNDNQNSNSNQSNNSSVINKPSNNSGTISDKDSSNIENNDKNDQNKNDKTDEKDSSNTSENKSDSENKEDIDDVEKDTSDEKGNNRKIFLILIVILILIIAAEIYVYKSKSKEE